MSSKYYKRLDYIRVICCIAILLYHIGLLKGGYLAVCTFFMLSGYLSVISGFRKKEFSLKAYYLNRLKKIYLPLLIVVFITVVIVLKIPSINWMNLKPETTSILFGYNNFWQLNANLDYFVKHISSPFMHLWYISILIQFEIIFPLFFALLRKMGRKINKLAPCLTLLILGIISYLLFKKNVSDGNIMVAYYSTFSRSFSLFFGMLIGFIHAYFDSFILKNKKLNQGIFWIYIFLLILMFIFVDAQSKFFSISMIITTLLSIRLIDYGISIQGSKSAISILSEISYEIYLVQYPIIFLFQNTKINSIIQIPLIIIITFVIAYLLHFSINIKKDDKLKIIKIFLSFILLVLSLIGLYKYIFSKDYTGEMKKLESDLNKNREILKAKQEEYKNKEKNEEEQWQATLNDLNKSETEIKEVVKNLHIVGVGDSIMELTVNDLYNEFPNGYFDAKVNRTENQAKEVVTELKKKGILGDVILFNVGTNGNCNIKCKEELMELVGDRKVFWVNATNPDYDTFNPTLKELAQNHSNIHIIDWISVANAHPEYLIKDRVHPSVRGCKVFAETIYNSIYEQYLNEFNEQKQNKIKQHEEAEKNKITFLGNNLLLGAYDSLQKEYPSAEYVIDKNLNYSSLLDKLKKKIDDKTLSYNVIIMLDKKITKNDYEKITKLLENNNVILVDIFGSLEEDNIIDFYSEIKNNKKYTKFDNTHLTEKGNKALTRILKTKLKK
ncbi:MAG: acyltransferase [Bacilli bacterium]|nr:acyltransferase [Bacilli bacterium]